MSIISNAANQGGLLNQAMLDKLGNIQIYGGLTGATAMGYPTAVPHPEFGYPTQQTMIYHASVERAEDLHRIYDGRPATGIYRGNCRGKDQQMRWFFYWLYRKCRAARDVETIEQMNAVTAAKSDLNFPDGMHFHIHAAENGKVLQVFNAGAQLANHQAQFVGGGNRKQEQKTYVIPEGENVIEFITRALVEERIK